MIPRTTSELLGYSSDAARRQFMLEDIPDIAKIGDLIALATEIDFDAAAKSLEESTTTVGGSPERELLEQLQKVCVLGRQLKLVSQGTLYSLVAIFMAQQLADVEGRS